MPSKDKSRIDSERLKILRARSKSPVPPSNNTTKKFLTFRELQAVDGDLSKPKRQLPAIATPKAIASTPKVEVSAMACRIRQQILQSDQEAKSTSRSGTVLTLTKEPPMVAVPLTKRTVSTASPMLVHDSRERIERWRSRRDSRGSRSSTSPTTPVELGLETPRPATMMIVNQNSAAFFTPSPTTGTKNSSSVTPGLGASARASSSRLAPAPPLSSKKSASKIHQHLTPPLAPTSNKKIALKQRRFSASNSNASFSGSGTKRSPLRSLSNTPTGGCEDEDDIVSTRRNLDKRTARLRYSGEFSAQIAKCKQSPSSRQLSPVPTSLFRNRHACDSSMIKVYVRKRPIFRHETERGDFDVCQPLDDDEHSASVVIYKTIMAADMKTKFIQPISFAGLTAAFDSDVDSQEVYDRAVAPLVEAVLDQSSPAATLLMFGQTGSGKTYTMSACQERIASQIFATRNLSRSVQVQSFELAGKTCTDLIGFPDRFDSSAKDTPVKILEQEDGSVQFANSASVTVSSPEELSQLLARVNSRRATQSTLLNDESSRSHAIYQIRVADKSSPSRGSVLTLVDCAGTERRNDSIFHCKGRQMESAEINASLYALKECIRKRSLSQHVPYRSNLLTRVLRECFESGQAPLAVIATVAPNATDTEHTIETLKTICKLTNVAFTEGEAQKVETSAVIDIPNHPKQWNREELLEWMSRKQSLCPTKPTVASHLDGRAVMRMSKIQLRNAFYDGDHSAGQDRADSLFRSLRAEADRVARLDLKRRFAQSKTNRTTFAVKSGLDDKIMVLGESEVVVYAPVRTRALHRIDPPTSWNKRRHRTEGKHNG